MRTEEEIRLQREHCTAQLAQLYHTLKEQKRPGAWQMSQIALMESKIEVLRWTLSEVEQVSPPRIESA